MLYEVIALDILKVSKHSYQNTYKYFQLELIPDITNTRTK
jgi:hypothetical protein